jgi:hypothetical protein
LKKDKKFREGDPDGDGIPTWEEFLLGIDPFNVDSDNDGLPDGWEKEYWPQLNPADSKDAHLDFDYDPIHDAQGYDIGERSAQFTAIDYYRNNQPITWPGNPSITYVEPVFDETGPHYDNYEEYYRPYYPFKNKDIIRYIHTNPLNPDTDGDKYLDPDDEFPIWWPNGSVDPNLENSGGDKFENDFETPDSGISANVIQENTILEYQIEPIIPENNKIYQDISTLHAIDTLKSNHELYPKDIENDGI